MRRQDVRLKPVSSLRESASFDFLNRVGGLTDLSARAQPTCSAPCGASGCSTQSSQSASILCVRPSADWLRDTHEHVALRSTARTNTSSFRRQREPARQ